MAHVNDLQFLGGVFDESPESSAVVDICVEQYQDLTGESVAEPAAAEL